MKQTLRTIHVELVARKLEKLRGYLQELEELSDISLEAYERNAPAKRAIERLLQIIIETACDINGHFVAKLAEKAPATRRASFYEMVELGILDPDTAERLARSVGLRNRLVHDYNTLDNRLVHAAIREALEQYAGYGRIMHRYILEDSGSASGHYTKGDDPPL